MTTRRLLTWLTALVAALAVLPAAATAQKASFTDVEDEVMCISCNVPLNVAESPQADATRREIRRLIDQGLDKEQIKDRLVAQYGTNVLADPDTDGFGLATVLVPLGAAAALVGILLLLLPRWRRRKPSGPEEVAPLPEPDLERLEADMARYDR